VFGNASGHPVPRSAKDLDPLFLAPADPTRRAVVERLGRGVATTSELAAPFDMRLPSFMQPLDLLSRGGVVESSKAGRVRTCQLIPQSFRPAETWMAAQHQLWQARLDQLDDFLLTSEEHQ